MNFSDTKKYFFTFKQMIKQSFYFFSLHKTMVFFSLVLFSVFTNFIFVFHPLKGKKWFSKIYKRPPQQTLQKVDGPLIENDMNVRVLKVKHEGKIYLEFLSQQEDDSYLEINSVELKGIREGYFEYWGEMTSLLLLDDNGDGRLDVIAPTFDRFFVPQINLVMYNQRTNKFELKSKSTYPKVIVPDSRAY